MDSLKKEVEEQYNRFKQPLSGEESDTGSDTSSRFSSDSDENLPHSSTQMSQTEKLKELQKHQENSLKRFNETGAAYNPLTFATNTILKLSTKKPSDEQLDQKERKRNDGLSPI